MFPLLRHLVVVVFIIALLNIALLKVNMRNSDINVYSHMSILVCVYTNTRIIRVLRIYFGLLISDLHCIEIITVQLKDKGTKHTRTIRK